MDAPEMHIMFRQYAQQMGMQNVRAILPEQIDLCLNTSVMDIVNQIIKENISSTNDRVITDNSKIGQINALRTLYQVKLIDMSPEASATEDKRVFTFSAADRHTGRMTAVFNNNSHSIPDYMYLVDFSINYKKVKNNFGYDGKTARSVTDYVSPVFEEDGLETNYFPVRLIDDSYLADTLNDFILKPRLRSPIMVVYKNGENNVFDLYIDKFKKVGLENDPRYVLNNNLVPYMLRMSYIAKPKLIEYREDLGPENKNCDLPEYLHVDVVKHAVDLYRTAISGSAMAAQNQEQAARQEAMRNNYRNEGNQ